MLPLGCASAHTGPIALQPHVVTAADLQAAERLAAGVRFETVSYDGRPDVSGPAFLQLHEHLTRSFPLAHGVLEREVINRYSLLYRWAGTDPDAGAILLSAHLDVVPIEVSTLDQWQQPPFSGAIVDGEIWGRGTWDDKGNLFAMLEAVERLVAVGFVPRQTVYFAFGHNEEVGAGSDETGARAIATRLAAKHVRLDFVLDEGLLVVDEALAGLAAPLALIGVAEKGNLSVMVTARATPGHSSAPSATSAIGKLSRALVALEEHPLPAAITGVSKQMLEAVAPSMTGLRRFMLSNLWLFEPLVRSNLSASPNVNAMMRTTTAFTVLSAGGKGTTLPGLAQAQVNFRLLPGDTAAAVLSHVKHVIGDDPDLEVVPFTSGWEGSRVSDATSPSYRRLERSIRAIFPEAVVAPGLMLGATDSRAYDALAEQIYRFSPLRGSPTELSRFHGLNERVSISGYVKMIDFYQHLLAEPQPAPSIRE